jgi:hypothetical protein
MDQTQSIQAVISNIVSIVGALSTFIALGTFGATELAKKSGLPTRFAALFAYLFGFFTSILICKIALGGGYFTPLNILIGLVVAFGTPGIYSGIKSMKSSKEETN